MPSFVDLGIPASDVTVNLQVFDISSPLSKAPAAVFISPILPGNENLAAPMYSFLIEHPIKKQLILFDLGPRKDVENSPPGISANKAFDIVVEKDITERLTEAGIALESINTAIWSHAHFDHIGDMSKFPPTTELVVGQGTVRDIYPANPNGRLLASDLSGRKVRELNFDRSSLSIGGFRALDYFDDGSLYLLDVPGHLAGHIGALARVTPTSFVFLGGDTCHHAGQLRPTGKLHRYFPCPGELLSSARHMISTEYFTGSSADSGGFDLAARMEPLLDIPDGTVYEDIAASRVSVQKLGDFDANADVFVMIAHDSSLVPVVEEFPATLNTWKTKGWKERCTWAFVDAANPAFRFSVKG